MLIRVGKHHSINSLFDDLYEMCELHCLVIEHSNRKCKFKCSDFGETCGISYFYPMTLTSDVKMS